MLQHVAQQQPQRIALSLPFSGRLQKAGEAIRDGFVAALFEARSKHLNTRGSFCKNE